MAKKRFKVTGMSCAACSAAVERAVRALGGVERAEVNLLLGSLAVFGEVEQDDVVRAVEGAGYGCSPEEGGARQGKEENKSEKNGRAAFIARLSVSGALLLILMYVSMGYVMWGFPLPAYFVENPLAVALVELLLSAAIMVINQKFFINGTLGLFRRSPNMDTLVSLGSSASFGYSTYVLFSMIGLDRKAAGHLLHSLYFEAAAMILVLVSVGKFLENIAKGKTTDAVRRLMQLSPDTALVKTENGWVTRGAAELLVGDIFALKKGDRVPSDGEIILGECSLDTSHLTGESMPEDRAVGGRVFAGSTVLSGYAEVRATEVGEKTALSRVIEAVKEAAGSKAPVARIADRVSAFFVPTVLIISLITLLIWLAVGRGAGFAIARAVSVLVISCPCALGLATPVAIMVGVGVGAREGILFKNAEALERCAGIKTVAFDKTGTVTEGRPVLTDLIPLSVSEEELISVMLSLEEKSEHPLAVAITEYARERGAVAMGDAVGFTAEVGGLFATLSGEAYYAGNREYIRKKTGYEPSDELSLKIDALSSLGKTVLIFTREKTPIGICAVSDAIKADAPLAVAELSEMGIDTVMITGDNARCAAHIATEAGIKRVFAEVFPAEKAAKVKELSAAGAVAMVGDGVNDSPALASADIGMAIGGGSDIAVDSADVVLTGGGIYNAALAVRLARKTLSVIKRNLFFAFVYNIIGIPLAAGAFIPLFGWEMNPMFASFAMSLSSLLVVGSSVALNSFRGRALAEKTETENKKENEKMKTVTVKIEGMMCPHCSGRVRDALLSLDFVVSADVSHERGDATVTLADTGDISKIKEKITEAGYKVIE